MKNDVEVHSEHSTFVPVVPTCQSCNEAALSLSAPQPIHVTSKQNSTASNGALIILSASVHEY